MNRSTRIAALRATSRVTLALTVSGCSGWHEEPEASDDDLWDNRNDDVTSGEEGGSDGSSQRPSDGTGGDAGLTDDEVCCGSASQENPEELSDLELCQATGNPNDVDERTAQCCAEALPVHLMDGEFGARFDLSDSEVRACCIAVLAHEKSENVGWEPPKEGEFHSRSCCPFVEDSEEFPELHWGGSCTPWGPPVPPRVATLPRFSEAA